MINCHNALEVGLSLIDDMIGQNFGTIKMSRKARVQPISKINASVKIDNETISIEPLLLFQRISLVKKSDEELQCYFDYELAPYPLSLFNNTEMRKTTKSTLYECFQPTNIELSSNFIHVVDGGYFLHRVIWQQQETFNKILYLNCNDSI